MKKKRIGILTGGGDCPGINAVIRAVAKKAIYEKNMEVIGIEDGYHGLIDNRWRILHYNDVSGILTLGGTILGTSKTANPYQYAVKKEDQIEFQDLSKVAIQNIRKLSVTCLVCIGGDGTLGPTPFDRILATGLGAKAVDMIEDKRFGYMVGVKRNTLVSVPLKEVAKRPKTVPLNHPMMKAARSLGMCFGD